MKTKLFSFLILILFLLGIRCSVPSYLPTKEQIDISIKGAYVKLNLQQRYVTEGELITVDEKEVIILTNVGIRKVEKTKIKRFKVIYAAPRKLGWLVALLTLSTAGHGYFMVFTVPLTLIGGPLVANRKYTYRFTNNDIDFNEMKKYARFPQGIPAGLKIEAIR